MAHQINAKTKETEKICSNKGLNATGAICMSIRDPTIIIPDVEVAHETAMLMRRIREIMTNLTQEHHMCAFFIRQVWATIMDPSEQERIICENSIRDAEQKEN